MTSVEHIIDRMREASGTKNDVELAEYLGLTRSNAISSWKSRQSKPYAYCELISQNAGVTMDWLLTGKEPKFSGSHDKDPSTAKLLDMLRQLSDEHRREILSRAESLHTSNQQSKRIEELEQKLAEVVRKIS